MKLIVCPSADAAATRAASFVRRSLGAALARRPRASVALSGGTTPAAMLRELARLGVPWAALDVFQVDERVAAAADPARNAHLLEPIEAAGARVHLMPVEDADLDAAARRYAATLPGALDLVHLGMGEDGHTASWAPGDAVALAPGAVGVSGDYRGHRRMTLTVGAVNAARSRMVLVTGEAKAPALRRWFAGGSDLPIERLRRGATTVIADTAAAQGLAHAR